MNSEHPHRPATASHLLGINLPTSIPSWGPQSAILLVDDDPFLAQARKSMLERRFRDVQRAGDAAEALIKLEDRGFSDRLRLIVVSLRHPGLSGPAFVRELGERLPGKPIVVVGAAGEIAPDYRGEHVRFLPRHARPEDLLAAACDTLSGGHARVA